MKDEKGGFDFETALVDVLQAAGENSVVVRVLRCLVQSILFVGCFYVTQILAELPITKDTEGFDGWNIRINIDDIIQIQHHKRNTSLATVSPSVSFGFDWVFVIRLNRMGEFLSARLKVSSVFFGPETDPAFRQKITQILCGGQLILM
uniref:Ras guanine nucleotide exchange factor glfB-like C-terminal domain-containing protein n=1 Tax=Paramoeba aestuarina TaxID=180227 RepID=A0A7S4UZP2_9EUKA